jgi:hypothetical protein
MEAPEVPTEHLHEEMEHQAQHGQSWIMGVALSSAFLAAFAAVASLKAGHYANEAMASQIEAANQWSYYQSKSIKESQLRGKVEILEALNKTASEADKAKLTEYAKEKGEIQHHAEELTREAKSELHTHVILAHGVTLFQIAIAVGAISALTRKKPFWFVSLGAGLVGLGFLVQAFLSLGH